MKHISYIFYLSLMLSIFLTSSANASIVYSGLLNQEGFNFSIDINNNGEIDFLTEDKALIEVKYERELNEKQLKLFREFPANQKIIVDSFEKYIDL